MHKCKWRPKYQPEYQCPNLPRAHKCLPSERVVTGTKSSPGITAYFSLEWENYCDYHYDMDNPPEPGKQMTQWDTGG